MTTQTIHPIPGALDEFNAKHPGHIEKLCEALQTSVKHRGSLSNDDDTAHCCLGVSCRVEGATFNDYRDQAMPFAFYAKASQGLAGIYVATHNYGGVTLPSLNDATVNGWLGAELSHQQIAELLQGRAVTVEVAHD